MSGLFSSKRLRWFAAAIVILNGVFPALWILFTSLKTENELTQKPITYWPHEPTIGNFISAFQDQPLLTFLTNSLIVAGLSTLLSLFISALAAYAIARLRLRFRGLILTAIIGVSMFPLVTLMVPLFEIMRSLGLLNSYWALVLPYTVLNLPICTLMMVSFSRISRAISRTRPCSTAAPASAPCGASCCRWPHRAWRRPPSWRS